MITRYKFFFYHYSKYRLITNLNSILIRTDTYNNSNQTSFLQYLLLPACLHFGQLQLLGVRPQQRDNPMLYLLDQLKFNKILKFLLLCFLFVMFSKIVGFSLVLRYVEGKYNHWISRNIFVRANC